SGIRWFEGNGLCHGVPPRKEPCHALLSHRVPFPDLRPAHRRGAGAGGDHGPYTPLPQEHCGGGVQPSRQNLPAAPGRRPAGAPPGHAGAQAGLYHHRRRQLPGGGAMIYLDSAATTLRKPTSVARACAYAIDHLATPGRGGHRPAMAAAEMAFACRREAAALFAVPEPVRVVFTFNATHGLNIAIKTLVKPGSTVLISGYEHNAVTRPLRAIPGVTVKVAASPLFDRAAALEVF